MTSISGYLVITRPTGNKSKNDRCKYLSIGIFRWQGIAKATGTRSRENIGEYCQNIPLKQSTIRNERVLRKEVVARTQSQILAKSFNPNRRGIRIPEYRRGVKDPNTTLMATWAHGPHSHVSKTVFNVQTRLRPRSWKGDSYRQSALILTCDAPDSIVH